MTETSGYQGPTSRFPKEPLIVAALIVTVSVALAVGGIVYKTRDSLQRDKIEFLADSNQKQVAPLRRVIQLRLAQDKARLIQFAATRSALGPGRSRVFGDFALVSLLTPESAGQWSFAWIEKGPLYSHLQGRHAGLSSDQEITLLKSLPYDRIREGDIYWQRLSDNSGRPVWALAVSVETQSGGSGNNPAAAALPEGTDYQTVKIGTGGRAVVVGLFGRNPLLSATEDFIGSTSTAFVIDSRGYAATHSNKTMVGSLMRDDPAVKEVFSARASAGASRYQGAQGSKIFSAFEQVDRSNLYVVMSTPETVTASSAQSFGRTAIGTGALALIVGLFLVFAWGARLIPRANSIPFVPEADSASASEYRRPNAIRAGVPLEPLDPLDMPAELNRTSKPPQQTLAADTAANLVVNQARDRAAFVGRFVTGLERGMKEPLLSAMAHVQLVKAKSGDTPSVETMTEISDHVTAVDRDLRRAKEMIDELGQLSSQSGVPTAEERADLNRIVSSVVDLHESSLRGEGVALSVDATSVPLIKGREEPIRKVLDELLRNAKRSLKSRTGKSIRVTLDDVDETVMLSVTDNGVGMDRETRSQAFEPFFHAFEDADARGLGLATVRSIVHAQGGTCEISSLPGDGTTVKISWPVLASEREAFAKQPVKVQTTQTASSAMHTNVDFAQEGAYVLGGKVPLAPEHAEALPATPSADDDEDEAWSFNQEDAKSALGRPASVSPESSRENEPELLSDGSIEPVKIRPVRRG